MFLVAGLGNPGEEYAATPHNMGFLVVDRLAARYGIRLTRKECQALVGQGTIRSKTVLLVKPQTYMNLSGVAIKPLMEKNEIPLADFVLVYDDLDLPWSSLRVRPHGSPGGHNGIKDVVAKLGTQEFPRVRLGVHPSHPLPSGKDYLLSRFNRQQTETLDAFVDLAADATESIIAEGVESSMAKFNRRAQGFEESAKGERSVLRDPNKEEE
ncbi:MAG TPA: aminoacyl-tRNA hydrolase [Bryobacteraceae bacterium]|jgi:PTH1 family peptidyl-tRNA hydrolase|nr:aminoacyl-tRNA hydrolase [Bryobacteraceae bacterium]